jgi:hypothetical protein
MQANISVHSPAVNLNFNKNKGSKRVYRHEMDKAHRKQSKAQSKRRKSEGKTVARRNFKGTLNEIQFLELIMFQTYLGTETKQTSRQWLCDDSNILRDTSEKQLSIRTIDHRLKKSRQATLNGNPIIQIKSPRRQKIDYTTGQHSYTTLGVHISIINIDDFILYYARLLAQYYNMLAPDLTAGFIDTKVRNHVKAQINKTGGSFAKCVGDKFAMQSVDNLLILTDYSTQKETSLRNEGDKFAIEGGQVCEFISITDPITTITKNITESLRATVTSFDSGKPREDGLMGFSDLIPDLNPDKKLTPWEEDEDRKDKEVISQGIDPKTVESVNIMMSKYQDDFATLKRSTRLYRQAARELAQKVHNMLPEGSNLVKKERMGLANYVVEEYLKMARLYGHNEEPEMHCDKVARLEREAKAARALRGEPEPGPSTYDASTLIANLRKNLSGGSH